MIAGGADIQSGVSSNMRRAWNPSDKGRGRPACLLMSVTNAKQSHWRKADMATREHHWLHGVLGSCPRPED